MTNATTPTTITDAYQRRIRAAMNRMPYAASTRLPKPSPVLDEPVDADAVVAFLDGLAAVLTEVAERTDADRRRLSRSTPTCRRSAALAAPPPPRRPNERAHRVARRRRDQRPGLHPRPGLGWVLVSTAAPVLILAQDNVIAFRGTPAELRALAAPSTAVGAAASARLDLAAEAG